ncbi:MAG: hypothetical protein MUO59_01830 [Actinobacteria bacterium]|nr:hypothetical protein [Actinomycetota bacterium]
MSKINISLDKEFLIKLNYYSHKENMTRSGFIREAVGEYIVDIEKEKELEEKSKKVTKAMTFFRDLARKNNDWDGVSEINKWRDRIK